MHKYCYHSHTAFYLHCQIMLQTGLAHIREETHIWGD
jgi:hypothetical protein